MSPAVTTAPPTTVHTVTTADVSWYRDVISFAQHTDPLHAVLSAYTSLSIVLLGALVVYSWWSARHRADRAAMAAVLWTAIGTGVSIACGMTLKQVFTETRPCLALAHVTTVEPCPGPTDYSFPSDHTVTAAALAVGLWLVNRKLGRITVTLALLEGFSRIYLGMHYPHDVVAGLLLATVVMLGGWRLVRGPFERLLAFLETTRLRPCVSR